LNSSLHHAPLSPSPIPAVVSIGLVFPFTYTCTYFHHIHPPTPSPHILPPPTGTKPPSRTCAALLLSTYVKNKMIFCLFKRAIQGEFSCDIYTCIYVLLLKLVHLYFSPFFLGPVLMVISTGLKILHSFLYRKHINHIHLLIFLLLPSLSH
jgi:hypothetical protein